MEKTVNILWVLKSKISIEDIGKYTCYIITFVINFSLSKHLKIVHFFPNLIHENVPRLRSTYLVVEMFTLVPTLSGNILYCQIVYNC